MVAVVEEAGAEVALPVMNERILEQVVVLESILSLDSRISESVKLLLLSKSGCDVNGRMNRNRLNK